MNVERQKIRKTDKTNTDMSQVNQNPFQQLFQNTPNTTNLFPNIQQPQSLFQNTQPQQPQGPHSSFMFNFGKPETSLFSTNNTLTNPNLFAPNNSYFTSTYPSTTSLNMAGLNAYTTGTNHLSVPTPEPGVDELCKAFEKLNLCNGYFSEVFYYLFRTQPNTIVNYNPVQQYRMLDGKTTFHIRHEQDFLKQIQQYNSLASSKFSVELKKETSSNYTDCVYCIRISSKKT